VQGETVVWLVCAVIAAGAIGFTLFVRQRDVPPAPVENPELKHLETRRQVLYDNLKDLQFEYHQGKLSEGDYQSLKSGFLGDLAAMMEAIERLQQATGARSKEVTSQGLEDKEKLKHAKTQPGVNVCPSCRAENQPDHRFCGKCGKALAP
jgi:ribosomal protein L32